MFARTSLKGLTNTPPEVLPPPAAIEQSHLHKLIPTSATYRIPESLPDDQSCLQLLFYEYVGVVHSPTVSSRPPKFSCPQGKKLWRGATIDFFFFEKGKNKCALPDKGINAAGIWSRRTGQSKDPANNLRRV